MSNILPLISYADNFYGYDVMFNMNETFEMSIYKAATSYHLSKFINLLDK